MVAARHLPPLRYRIAIVTAVLAGIAIGNGRRRETVIEIHGGQTLAKDARDGCSEDRNPLFLTVICDCTRSFALTGALIKEA